MILQVLNQCYEDLAAAGKLDKPGWSPVKASWALELNEKGETVGLWPLGDTDEKGKRRSRSFVLPEQVKKTSGVKSNFLCENAAYILGIDSKGNPERARQCFEACKRLHTELLEGIEQPLAQAIIGYFRRWEPALAREHAVIAPQLKEITAGGNLVFCMGETFAHEIPEIRAAWDNAYASVENVVFGRCLVTGEMAPVAILHPSIKGVAGAQASGASLVSFNARAFESYGREEAQGLNAPVSTRAAFGYGAALNYMLSERDYHTRLGDTTVVYWAEGGASEYSEMMISMLKQEDGSVTQQDITGAMRALAQGRTAQWRAFQLSPEHHFYMLGLAPNASRLSVRFFMQDTFGHFAQNLMKHQEQMEIVCPPSAPWGILTLWDLLQETANQKSSKKEPPAQMIGDVTRAILMGTLYPASLYAQVQLRLRAEKQISRNKAAIIKAYLLRNVVKEDETHPYKEALGVKLNENTSCLPYRLGRLFAVLERLQEAAAGKKLNTTIRDRYFNSACSTPATVFPRLVALAQNHLRKLNDGSRIYYTKLISELFSGMDESYPVRLSLQEQGVFQIGYYHQTQYMYTKKEDKNNG